jgi:hypothetical protein
MIKCEVCSIEFQSKWANTKYCSKKCKRKAYLQRSPTAQLLRKAYARKYYYEGRGKQKLQEYQQTEEYTKKRELYRSTLHYKRLAKKWRKTFLAKHPKPKSVPRLPLYTAKERLQRDRLADKNKWHKKRAKGQSDITNPWLIDLWYSTTVCIICNKKMESHGLQPYGKHLDHIIPLTFGGTHTMDNVRFIHARCNVQRDTKIKTLIIETMPEFRNRLVNI